MAGRRHDELLCRDVRRDGAGDVFVRMGRRHDQHEVGAGDRGAGIVGDERKRREALAQQRPRMRRRRWRDSGVGGAAAAAVEPDVEAALRQMRRRRAAAVACADDGDGLDRTHRPSADAVLRDLRLVDLDAEARPVRHVEASLARSGTAS